MQKQGVISAFTSVCRPACMDKAGCHFDIRQTFFTSSVIVIYSFQFIVTTFQHMHLSNILLFVISIKLFEYCFQIGFTKGSGGNNAIYTHRKVVDGYVGYANAQLIFLKRLIK